MGNKLVSFIVFVAMGLGVKYAVLSYQNPDQANNLNDAAQVQMTALQEEAKTQFPDDPDVVALQKAAIKKADEKILSANSEQAQKKTAAGVFLGFYLVNTRERVSFCKTQGVDISPFATTFRNEHVQVHNTAINALAISNKQVDALYKQLKPQLSDTIRQDMQFIAQQNGVSVAEACQLVSDNAEMLVDQMKISVAQPTVYATLMYES